jgi:plastocyanin
MCIGKEAFLVLIILGAIKGLVIYPTFHSIAPVPGVMFSLYRMNLTPQDIAAANPQAGASGSTGAGSGAVEASVTIPAGASTQGNPAYAPDTLTVKKGDSVAVTNKDSVPHTITNGKDPSDPTSGKLFDTSIISSIWDDKIGCSELSFPLLYTSIHDRIA